MTSIWPVAAINKIKSKRKDLIKENDIKRSIKSRKNANIHIFIYKKKFFLFWDQGITRDQSTLLHVSWRVTCKEQVCGKSTVYVWPLQIRSWGWRMCRLEAEGPLLSPYGEVEKQHCPAQLVWYWEDYGGAGDGKSRPSLCPLPS